MNRIAAILIALASLFALAPAANADNRLLVASGGEHLWIVRESPRTPGTFELLHHAIDMRGPHAASMVPLHMKPEAIAALGDRVWIISPPRDERAGGRSVSTLRVRERPEIEMYTTEPEGRLALLDMLPGNDVLLSVTAVAGRPVALMRSDGLADDPGSLRLHELRGERWRAAPLPPLGEAGDVAMLAVDGPDLARLNLLVADPHDPSKTLLYRRDGASWSDEPVRLDLDLRTVHSLTHVRGRLAASLLDETVPGADVEIVYVRPSGLVPLTVVELPDDPRIGWGVVGMDDGFRAILQRDVDDAALHMSAIHWITGEVGPFEPMSRPPLPAGRLWHITIMLTIAVLAVLLVLLVRPGAMAGQLPAKDALQLPKGTAIFSPISRTFALMIDLVPGAILALLIMRVPPVELLRLPIITHSLDQAAPHLIMLGITLAHITLTELLKATSLGKALMGGRVISMDGARPAAKQILIRNALKAMILIVPPLAVFALLSRHLQGFNDLLAGTLVIGDLPPDVEDDESPGDEGSR